MDDVLRRLGVVESSVAELRGEVRHLATKADLKEAVGALSAQIATLEARMIKWLIATILSSVGLAAAVAKHLV